MGMSLILIFIFQSQYYLKCRNDTENEAGRDPTRPIANTIAGKWTVREIDTKNPTQEGIRTITGTITRETTEGQTSVEVATNERTSDLTLLLKTTK